MKTALIIEDNADNMVLITRLLEKAGGKSGHWLADPDRK